MLIRSARAVAAVVVAGLVLVACGGGGEPSAEVDLSSFDEVEAAAEGQTVRWWLFGGDDRINSYIETHVVPAAEELGITLERVPVDDTADAVNRVVAERRAGEEQGEVDLIWINGANFADGAEADLWLEDWARELPNAQLVDPDTVDEDFGVPVEGRESPWSRALFVFAHDSEALPTPPADFQGLLDYARENPGRVTYPAPPDFTGSAFVRQVIQKIGEDAAFDYLAELDPLLWREGEAYPGDEAELNQLFADGEVDLAMSYDPAFVETAVAQGQFPESARPFVLDAGTLENTSYVTIPENAANTEGALAVANLLLEPELQAIKADPAELGVPTVLDREQLSSEQQDLFAETVESPYLVEEYGDLVEELPADRVEELDQRWRDEILDR